MERKIRKKRVLAVIIIIFVLGACITFSNRHLPKEIESMPEIKWAILLSPTEAPTLWALENNMTKLPTNVKVMFTTINTNNEIFLGKQADIGLLSLPTFAISEKNNPDYYHIIKGANKALLDGSLVYYKENNIRMDNLEGKIIAVPDLKYNTVQAFLAVLDKKYNLSANNITLLPTKNIIVPELIERKDVDGGIVLGYDAIRLCENPKFECISIYEEFKDLFGIYPLTHFFIVKNSIETDSRIKEIDYTYQKLWESGYQNLDKVRPWYKEKYGVDIDFSKTLTPPFMKFANIEDRENEEVVMLSFEYFKKSGVIERIPPIENLLLNEAHYIKKP